MYIEPPSMEETKTKRQRLVEDLRIYKTPILLGMLAVVVFLLPLFMIIRSSYTKKQPVISPIAKVKPTSTPSPTTPVASPSASPTPTDTTSTTDSVVPSTMPVETPNNDSVIYYPSPTPMGIDVTGYASYYSRAGCVGCSKKMATASGQILNDYSYTIAFNLAPLGTLLYIRNVNTGATIRVRVNDRGGFNSLGRVADMTLGVKQAIGCSSLCLVRIYQ